MITGAGGSDISQAEPGRIIATLILLWLILKPLVDDEEVDLPGRIGV